MYAYAFRVRKGMCVVIDGADKKFLERKTEQAEKNMPHSTTQFYAFVMDTDITNIMKNNHMISNIPKFYRNIIVFHKSSQSVKCHF